MFITVQAGRVKHFYGMVYNKFSGQIANGQGGAHIFFMASEGGQAFFGALSEGNLYFLIYDRVINATSLVFTNKVPLFYVLNSNHSASQFPVYHFQS